MGQKVNPIGFRLGMRGNWPSKCYVSNKNFPDMLYADIKAREFLQKKYVSAAISRIEIERLAQNIKINLYSARPGSIIGKSGRDIDNLRNELARELGVPMQSVYVNIREIRKPDLDAKLVAESIAAQLVKRVAFRRAMKKAVSSTMKAGAEGIKICASGRLGGAEIARTEWTREGRIPLHTLRADIDYALAEAHTTYGIIGVKVWICKGEMLEKEELDKPQQQPEQKAKAKHEVKHHAVHKKSEHHDKNDEKVADHKHKDEGESATKKTKVSETKEVKETKVKRVAKTSKAPAKAKSHAKKEKAKEE